MKRLDVGADRLCHLSGNVQSSDVVLHLDLRNAKGLRRVSKPGQPRGRTEGACLRGRRRRYLRMAAADIPLQHLRSRERVRGEKVVDIPRARCNFRKLKRPALESIQTRPVLVNCLRALGARPTRPECRLLDRDRMDVHCHAHIPTRAVVRGSAVHHPHGRLRVHALPHRSVSAIRRRTWTGRRRIRTAKTNLLIAVVPHDYGSHSIKCIKRSGSQNT